MNNHLSGKVIGLAIDVHRELGPGLLENAYEEALSFELGRAGVFFERQLSLPVNYKGQLLDCKYQMDIVVEKQLVLELKAVEQLIPIHQAQLLTYLKLSGISLGLLINFNELVLRQGIKRLIL
ncbi:GxxExxY protein [Endozoicomonas sp. SESOKO1]|uniref:GxxExxY protein n=1 Tax=Endozoicomonas sp. SESOKO1 TaxID=2828742 RepID=UPI00214957E5|nr:GxxExxY protein [Endozoicomonas sp. SESOKO1]